MSVFVLVGTSAQVASIVLRSLVPGALLLAF
jgi:hypothetical protein